MALPILTKEASDECNARTGGTIITIGAYLVTIVSLIVAASNPTALLITSILATAVYIFLLYLCRRIFVLYLAIIAFGVTYISAGCILVGATTGEAFSWHPLHLASTAAALLPLSLIYLAAGYSLKRKKISDLAPHIHYVGLALWLFPSCRFSACSISMMRKGFFPQPSSLFLFLYRRFQRYQAILLYLSVCSC